MITFCKNGSLFLRKISIIDALQGPEQTSDYQTNFKYEMLCAIWYHLYYLKNVKNTHSGVLLLVKLQAKAWNITKSNTPLWIFFTFLKLYKWYQIAQRITNKPVEFLVWRVDPITKHRVLVNNQRKDFFIRST